MKGESMGAAAKPQAGGPGVKHLFLSFLRLGLTAFGGPVMVAYIGELAVKRKKWLDQETFKQGVALCQSIPGATAMQSAAYVGFKINGVPGALAAYVGFGLPAFALMAILSSLYVAAHGLSWIAALFSGLQVMVVAIVANAMYTFGRGALKRYPDFFLAGASACAFGLGVSPFYVIIGAALAGIGFGRTGEAPSRAGKGKGLSPAVLQHIIILLLVIFSAILFLYFFQRNLFTLALLMCKIDLFAFGGGFSSLPLMLQEIVNVRGWMDAKTFMDGIALGQVTPGPIVITATFVGYHLYGFVGAVAATIAIFTPSFVLLITGALFFDRLKQSPFFRSATTGALASFVGLLLYVTVKFAFAVPWDAVRIAIAVATLAALIKKVDIVYIVPTGAVLSVFLFR
jgi:chromate transporter